MLQCWYVNPDVRPFFTDLEKQLEKFLEAGVADHYVDLNQQYLQANETNYCNKNTDYSAILSTPQYPAPSVPLDVNQHILQNDSNIFVEIDMHASEHDDMALASAMMHNATTSQASGDSIQSQSETIPKEVPMLNEYHDAADGEIIENNYIETES